MANYSQTRPLGSLNSELFDDDMFPEEFPDSCPLTLLSNGGEDGELIYMLISMSVPAHVAFRREGAFAGVVSELPPLPILKKNSTEGEFRVEDLGPRCQSLLRAAATRYGLELEGCVTIEKFHGPSVPLRCHNDGDKLQVLVYGIDASAVAGDWSIHIINPRWGNTMLWPARDTVLFMHPVTYHSVPEHSGNRDLVSMFATVYI
jgi:hypothetical protein